MRQPLFLLYVYAIASSRIDIGLTLMGCRYYHSIVLRFDSLTYVTFMSLLWYFMWHLLLVFDGVNRNPLLIFPFKNIVVLTSTFRCYRSNNLSVLTSRRVPEGVGKEDCQANITIAAYLFFFLYFHYESVMKVKKANESSDSRIFWRLLTSPIKV